MGPAVPFGVQVSLKLRLPLRLLCQLLILCVLRGFDIEFLCRL